MSTERFIIGKDGKRKKMSASELNKRMLVESANSVQGEKDQAKRDYIALKKSIPVSVGGRNYLFSERLRSDFLQQINLDEIDTVDSSGELVTLTPLEAIEVQKEMKRVIKEAYEKFKAV